MKLIVGLGNPDKKYEGTRHNIGFEVIEELARRWSATAGRGQFHGETREALLDGTKIVLLRPLTYMNRSGGSVQAARDFYKLELPDLLVACDDTNLPLAKLRIRAQGSSGGQKGLEDVIRRLGTEKFSRLRVGIGPPPPQWDMADYVLSKFGPDEHAEIKDAIQRAASAAESWIRDGIENCMNQYNVNG